MQNKKDMTIADAKIEHVDAILEIENVSFSDPWHREFFVSLIKSDSVHFEVAELNGEVIGYCILNTVLDEGEIYNIAVSPKMRRRKIGYLLLEESINYCSECGIRIIYLEVRAGNVKAINMYKKMGFKSIGIRRGYYEMPKEDGLIMTYKYKERQ